MGGMPRTVALAGFADSVVPLSEMVSLRAFSRRTQTHTRIRTIRS